MYTPNFYAKIFLSWANKCVFRGWNAAFVLRFARMCRFSGAGGEFLSFTGKGSRGAACVARLTEQLPKRVFHLSHGYDFYAGLDFFAAFYIVARYYYAFEAEFLGFEYSLGNACHGAYLAA